MVTPCNLPSYWTLFTSNLTSLILIRARWTLHRTRAPCRTVMTHGTIILRWRSCALSCRAVKSFSTLPSDSITWAVVARGACVAVFQGDVSFDRRERAWWARLWWCGTIRAVVISWTNCVVGNSGSSWTVITCKETKLKVWQSNIWTIGPDKDSLCTWNYIYFLTHQLEHVFWVLIRTLSTKKI